MSIQVSLQSAPVLQEAFMQVLENHASGAQVWFNGQVRNHSQGKKVQKLDFEAYEPMALKEMQALAQQATDQWSLHGILMVHRLGEVYPGETAVLIGVSSAHRKEAFAASEWMIDQLKLRVPIWKKEYTEDGEIWVAAHP